MERDLNLIRLILTHVESLGTIKDVRTSDLSYVCKDEHIICYHFKLLAEEGYIIRSALVIKGKPFV